MKMQLLKQEEQRLLNRKIVNVIMDYKEGSTPKNEDTLKSLSEFLKVNPETIKIQHTYTIYGTRTAKVIAKVYNSAEDLKRIEFKKKKVKQKKEEVKQEAKKEEVKK